jgi:hypothetical protein
MDSRHSRHSQISVGTTNVATGVNNSWIIEPEEAHVTNRDSQDVSNLPIPRSPLARHPSVSRDAIVSITTFLEVKLS